MNCHDCKTEMKKISTCCEAGSCTNRDVTHYQFEEPYYKCPNCGIESEGEE